MQSLSGRHFFQGLLYLQYSEFADMGPFMAKIDPIMDGTEYSFSSVECLEKIVTGDEFLSSDDDEEASINHYIAKIVQRSCDLFRNNDRIRRIALAHVDVEKSLEHYNALAHLHFSSIGIDVDMPMLYFVDDFPEPFGDKNFLAMSMDSSDLEIYGIPPGLYFKKSMLRPSYSVVILLHEWVHVVMSRSGERFFGGPLEEGLAEIYGCIFLASKLVDDEFARTVYIYHRLFSEQNKFLDLYLDYARQAYRLFDAVGIDGLHKVFKGSRADLKSTEADLWKEKFLCPRTGASADDDHQLRQTLNFLLHMAGKHSCCSALAKRISEFAREGETADSIALKSGIGKDAVMVGLKELTSAPRLVELKGEVVVYSDCERLVSPLQLRFTVKK